MSTMTIDEYNSVVKNSITDIAGVMQTSVAGDASTVANPQLTPEAKFEQVKNAL